MKKNKELMKEYNDEELRKLQLTELDILIEVIKICKQHNITYFLWGGTALGAERHQGFIPWDDDLDIVMLRTDYNRFLQIAPKLLPGDLFLQTHETDRETPFYFAKVRKNNTIFLENYVKNKKMHHGIYIDILVLDNVPEDAKKRNAFIRKNRLMTQLYLAKYIYKTFNPKNNFFKKGIRIILHILLIPISAEYLYKKLDQFVQKYNDFNTGYLKSSGIDNSEIFQVSDFAGTKDVKFESIIAAVPIENHRILTYRYGDYMKIPPVEKRYNHRPVKIEFDTK
jgi:lipopolysaccharide cholinephosphotransferase